MTPSQKQLARRRRKDGESVADPAASARRHQPNDAPRLTDLIENRFLFAKYFVAHYMGFRYDASLLYSAYQRVEGFCDGNN
jgi:hypothetical protein